MRPDYVVVGTGLTGAVFARVLQDAGHRVLAVERRSHVGGNVHDTVHPSGIRVHSYGPHYFRTSSARVWSFVSRYARFYRYEARVKSNVDGARENWPVAASYVRRLCGADWHCAPDPAPGNLEEAALALMPRVVYERFVKEYNEKQWSVPCRQLSAELCRRFDIRLDDDPRLTPHARFQGLPFDGYASFMSRLLAGVPIVLNCDYLETRQDFRPRRMTIYTGPIDAYFGYALGRLAYRGQRRETTYLPDTDWFQEVAQINEPLHAGGPHVRTLEWKHVMPAGRTQRTRGTVLTRETPCWPDRPDGYEYPFPDATNAARYASYRALAQEVPEVLICGRLGEYRYYDMDQAIARALHLVRAHLANPRHPA